MKYIEITSLDEISYADVIGIPFDSKVPLYEALHNILKNYKPKVCFGFVLPATYFDLESPIYKEFSKMCDEYNYAYTLYRTNLKNHNSEKKGVKVAFIFWQGNLCPQMQYFNHGLIHNSLELDILAQAKKFINGQLPMLNCRFVKQSNVSKKIDYAELFEPKLPFDNV